MIAAFVLLFSLAGLCAVYLFSGGEAVYQIRGDLQVYPWAVRSWVTDGRIPRGWAPLSNGVLLPWVYPPFAVLPLSPFGLVPMWLATASLWALNVLALATVIHLVTRHCWPSVGPRGAAVVTLAALSPSLWLEPVHSGFGQGQVNLLLMGVIALDCLAPWPRWPRGVLIGAAAAIKLTPAAFVLFFLVRRDTRSVIRLVVTGAACTALGFAVDARASVDYWFRAGPASEVAGHPLNSNQSVMGALARMMPNSPWQVIAWAIITALLVGVVVGVLRRCDAPTGMVAVGLLTLLVSPTSWSNHWVWCVPAVLLLFGAALRRGGYLLPAAGVLVTATVVVAPYHFLPHGQRRELGWTPWQHLIGDCYVLLAVLALLLLWWRLRRVEPGVNTGVSLVWTSPNGADSPASV
ncbi:alpha-1,2-mannosyltransferase [Actinopolyspora xinjiangensis]|uniref:Alpha-1,2-mannosyltransferase n=1 Tax=Actinopolyspora xinjiangensis TaxID=405564 RepID=A0A1H0TVB4_9ACTN|nr:alpha-1,2-mannosyltransferase [Actinopolyspora xinjiangensis]